MTTIKKITEEQLEVTTESVEILNKKNLIDRKASLEKDIERIQVEIVKVNELLSNFSE